ncbi:MAG: hypothetical protein FJ087_12600 [Deltaproteobacteria bacterium]|nr:hypothetical protein [Deltaproteobacteria bacterium]
MRKTRFAFVIAGMALAGCSDLTVPALPDAPTEAGTDAKEEVAKPPCEGIAEGAPCIPAGGVVPGKEYVCQDGSCVEKPSSPCDDQNPCTADSQDGDGTCRHDPLNEGACEDDDACTTDGTCFAGHCASKPVDCDDGNPCTRDLCDKKTGCVHPADEDATCDDGDACTKGDFCAAGKCHGGGKLVCDDGNACTTDECDAGTGSCRFDPNSAPCSDGDPCTEIDTCSGGACTGGVPTNCDDGEPCTDDRCLPTQGCVHTIQPGCLPCTVDGDCDDGNPCSTEACVATKCTSEPATGPACDDFNPCTEGDACDGGVCSPGALKPCDEPNPCTDDVCNQLDGSCGHTYNTAGCDDGNRCTEADRCSDGTCAGMPVACADSNVCTDDWCDPATGGCVFTPNSKPCDDGRMCTANDACSASVCAGTPISCDDGKACTIDACVEGSGCRHEDIAGCTSCANDAGCNDNNACTQDRCIDTQCQFTPLDGTPCQDGNACTDNDRCASGTCLGGTAKVCDDGKVCTANTCDPATGCVFAPLTGGECDDGDACTRPDTCQAGVCAAGPLVCCAGKPDGTICSDQDNATGPDFCLESKCVGTKKVTYAGVTNGATYLTDVDVGPTGAWATGYTTPSMTVTPTGFIAMLSFGAAPKPAAGTSVMGKAFRAVSRSLAVGDGGLVAFRLSATASAPWKVGDVLLTALKDDGDAPGDLLGAFSVPGGCPKGLTTCSSVEAYLVAGVRSGTKDPFAKECLVTASTSGSVSAACGASKFNDFQEPPRLAAASGAAGKCNVCSGMPPVCGPVSCMSEGVLAAVPANGGATTLFDETTDGSFLGPFADAGAFGMWDAADVSRIGTGPSAGQYLVVGQRGLVSAGKLHGGFSYVATSDTQADCDFRSVDARHDYTLIVGACTTTDGFRDLVLLLHPNASDIRAPGSWARVVLATGKSASGELDGVSGDATGIYVVGSEPGGTGTAVATVRYVPNP